MRVKNKINNLTNQGVLVISNYNKFQRRENNFEHRIDGQIREPKVLVIDHNGTNLGVISVYEAQKIADQEGLNLVELSPNEKPPMCKIMDYGKYRYSQKQNEKAKKKNQVVQELKEMRFAPNIGKHDFDFKFKHIQEFIQDGDKVKCVMKFKGRQINHTDLGVEMFQNILINLGEKIIIEQQLKIDGSFLSMIIAPNK